MGDALMVTDRISLHATGPEDETEFVDGVRASQELLHPWIDAPDSPTRFRAMLARSVQAEFHPFVVRAVEDGRLVGAINLSNVVRGPFLSAFTGYWAFAGGEGRGFLHHGVRAVVRVAFTTLGLHRLEANVQPGNEPSIRLAERCGFRYEGFSPHYLQVFGEWRDHNRYAITVETWDRDDHP